MKARVPRFLTFILGVILIAAFFLPILKTDKATGAAIDEFTEIAEELQIDTSEDVGGLSIKDLQSLSLFKLTKIYLSDEGFSGNSDNDKIAGIFFASVGVISILIALFALCKLPILTLIFDLIGAGAYALVNYAIGESLKSFGGYSWGIANILYIVLHIAIVAGSIWMLVAKIMDKKAARLQRG